MKTMNFFNKLLSLFRKKTSLKTNDLTVDDENKNSKIIHESKSPNCPLAVIVEEYETCTYMYLIHLKEDGIQSIVSPTWIRNHHKAPDDFELAKMQEGFSTMMPKEFCSHPNGRERLQPEDLRCVWFEEGDGVALLEKDSVLGIIPCWANDKVPAYSKDCIKENSFVFPITEENVLLERVRKADEFWNSWDNDPWSQFLNSRLEVLYKEFGEEKKYYAIDNGQWPIKGMARFEKGDMTYLVTIGVSLIPQPFVERVTETPEKLRRIELALAIKTNELMKNEMAICSFLSAQTTIPWNTLTWLGHGHTIECGSVFGQESEFPFGLFINSKAIPSLPQLELEPFRGDDINILWLTPIKESEFYVIKEGSADAFLSSKPNKKRTWIFGETGRKKNSSSFVPFIRPLWWFENRFLQSKIHMDKDIYFMPFEADLGIGFCTLDPVRPKFLTRNEIDSLGISERDLISVSVHNLEKQSAWLLDGLPIKKIINGLYSASFTHISASCLMLLKDEMKKLEFDGEPCVLFSGKDQIYIVGSNDFEKTVLQMKTINEISSPTFLVENLYCLRDDAWCAARYPQHIHRIVSEYSKRAKDYYKDDMNKFMNILKKYNDTSEDFQISEITLGWSDEQSFLCTLWIEAKKNWLPKVDRIILAPLSGQNAAPEELDEIIKAHSFGWEVVASVYSHKMKQLDHFHEVWEFIDFPTAEEIERMKKLQAQNDQERSCTTIK